MFDPDELLREIMAERADTTSSRERVTVYSVGQVDQNADPALLQVMTAHGTFERPSEARVLKPLHGFEFYAVGEVVTDPYAGEPSQIWSFAPREWDGFRLPAVTLKILRMTIGWTDAPLCFDRQWLDDGGTIDLPRVRRGGATPADYHRLADAYQALIRFTENMRSGGRRKKSEEQIRQSVDPIVRRLKNQGREPTEELVAALLPPSRGKERDPRVLRRWINDGLGMTWGEYVNSVNPEDS